jgi:protein-S-isoprenylcysteine O-methyltransferase Ste14
MTIGPHMRRLERAAAYAAVAVCLAALSAGAIFYGAFVAWVLWGWFVVPLGVPPISIAWVLGLSALVYMLTPTPPPPPKSQSSWLPFAKLYGEPTILLACGWIAKQFM